MQVLICDCTKVFARAGASEASAPSATWGVHPFSKVVPIEAASRRFFAREFYSVPLTLMQFRARKRQVGSSATHSERVSECATDRCFMACLRFGDSVVSVDSVLRDLRPKPGFCMNTRAELSPGGPSLVRNGFQRGRNQAFRLRRSQPGVTQSGKIFTCKRLFWAALPKEWSGTGRKPSHRPGREANG